MKDLSCMLFSLKQKSNIRYISNSLKVLIKTGSYTRVYAVAPWDWHASTLISTMYHVSSFCVPNPIRKVITLKSIQIHEVTKYPLVLNTLTDPSITDTLLKPRRTSFAPNCKDRNDKDSKDLSKEAVRTFTLNRNASQLKLNSQVAKKLGNTNTPRPPEPICICYPYPNGITFQSDPVSIRSQKGLV